MKLLRYGIFVISFFLISTITSAQEFEVPKNVSFEKAEDYAPYNKDIIAGMQWLETASIAENEDKAEAFSAFFLLWATGTPEITIEAQAYQLDLCEKNPTLLTVIFGGWAKYALENPAQKNNKLACNVAAISSALKVYKNNVGKVMVKDKRLEKLLKKSPKELEAWISKRIK